VLRMFYFGVACQAVCDVVRASVSAPRHICSSYLDARVQCDASFTTVYCIHCVFVVRVSEPGIGLVN